MTRTSQSSPRMRRVARAVLVALVPAALAAVACSQLLPVIPRGTVGGQCQRSSQCPTGYACSQLTNTCVPVGTPGTMDCTLTSECPAGQYCSVRGVCAPSGVSAPGDPCFDTGSCARGAVCATSANSIFGRCALPRGTVSYDAPDGGQITVEAGLSGTANGEGGTCMTVVDCQAGLLCYMGQCTRGSTVYQAAVSSNATLVCAPENTSSTAVAHFEIPAADGTPPNDFFRLPFPNDIRRDGTTQRLNLKGFPTAGSSPFIPFDIVDRYARAAEADLDGWSTNAVATFRFSGRLDVSSLDPNRTMKFVDLTTGAPRGYSFTYGSSGNRYLCENWVTIGQPFGDPLEGGHTYAVYMTTDIRSSVGGGSVRRDADFEVVMSSNMPSASDPRLVRAWQAYAPFRAYLRNNNTDPTTVLTAAVFTTQNPRRMVAALREAVQAGPMPVPSGFVKCAPGVRSPCDDGLTGNAHVRGCFDANPKFDEYQGRITIPVFQRGNRPYALLTEGGLAVDAQGRPQIQSQETVCVSITVPKIAPPGTTSPDAGTGSMDGGTDAAGGEAGTVDSGGSTASGAFPVLLYAHGTGGNYRSFITERLADLYSDISVGSRRTGFIMVGYEGVMHGDRRGMGVTETPDVLFFNFANPLAARDNVLQGTADVFALARFLSSDPTFLPTTDTNRRMRPDQVYFMGHSQGATVGAPAVQYEGSLAGFVLSGGGGDLRESLLRKRAPYDIGALTATVLRDQGPTVLHPALNLFQTYFDRSDAVNYARGFLVTRTNAQQPVPIVLTYGLRDSYTPNACTQVMQLASGIPVASPIVGVGVERFPADRVVGGMTVPGPSSMLPLTQNAAGTTAAMLEAEPPQGGDGHFVLFEDANIRDRVRHFLASTSLGMPVIPLTPFTSSGI